MVWSASYRDVDEVMGGQELHKGAPREDPQVTDDLVTRTTVDALQTHFGEQGLDSKDEERAIVPSGEVRS